MITKKGWADQLMLSLFLKEAAFDAGVTMSNANACSMVGFEAETAWEDVVENNKGEKTGTEHGTDQELIEQRVKIAYKEPKAHPNSLIGLAALTLGAITSTQDGAFTAYSHKITPVAAGTALPSIQAEEKAGGVQYAYKGVKGSTLKIAGSEAGIVSVESGLMGSGTRAESGSVFAASITESWLLMRNCKVLMANGADISIDAALTQGAENISAGGSPADFGVRLKSFEWSWDNALEGQAGGGGGGVYQDIDYGRRKSDLKFSLLFQDNTEMNHYLNQDALAIEFDLKGALIAAGGSMYYGFQLIIPRFKLKAAPLAKAGANDTVTCDFECDVQDDGTNPAVIIEAYNAKAAYLA